MLDDGILEEGEKDSGNKPETEAEGDDKIFRTSETGDKPLSQKEWQHITGYYKKLREKAKWKKDIQKGWVPYFFEPYRRDLELLSVEAGDEAEAAARDNAAHESVFDFFGITEADLADYGGCFYTFNTKNFRFAKKFLL